MKTIVFDKMHGAGNDYVYVDARHGGIERPESLAVKISDRHFGVGSDGLVLITKSEAADFGMRMFNADGSEAGMCGNASRCVGRYVYEKGLTDKTEITLETLSGIKTLTLKLRDRIVEEVSVGMGAPELEAARIPVLSPNPQHLPIVAEGEQLLLTCVSMGNPHAVAFVENVERYDVERIGLAVEHHPFFPARTNVEFVQVVSPSHLRMRVWERGSGETLACGTGACAALVVSALTGKAGRKAVVSLKGGDVEVEWSEETNRVTLTGGAEWVFRGEYFID